MITALFQVLVFLISGSTALLTDTIHNLGNAATAIPLGFAFILSRKKPNKRFTYGYGRAEDLAGLIIVFLIFLSAAAAVILYFLAGPLATLVAIATVLAGTVFFPVLLPFIPTHDFSTKGLILDGLLLFPL